MGLVIEDHNLHRHNAWGRSHDYGKQPRMWSRLLGTTFAGVEGYIWEIDFAKNPYVVTGH